MKTVNTVNVLLFIAGVIAISIGGGLTFFPVEFQASAKILLDRDNFNLLSEIRSPGGVLLLSGLTMIVGAFRKKMQHLSLTVVMLIYLGYGFGRLVGLVIDGIPHQSLLIALVVEMIIGVLAGVALLKKSKAS